MSGFNRAGYLHDKRQQFDALAWEAERCKATALHLSIGRRTASIERLLQHAAACRWGATLVAREIRAAIEDPAETNG